MSTSPENELDLEKLFLPAWAQEPASTKQYAQYEGGGERPERRGDQHGRRPGRRDGFPGARQREGGRPPADRPGARRPGGDKRPFNRDRPSFRREDQRERREPPPPPPEVNVQFVPDEKGVESLARQIKMTGRAYPLFDIARLILQKPERHGVTFGVRKKPDGEVAQPLFVCALDETLWLSEDEAIAHVLRHHFGTFYQTERTATEPPKGKYTFVAQCGMSGVILGPPNYHDYQNQLRKLHTERFSRMPFEAFKARVKIVRDEEVVKKWIDDQSWKTEYVCLNMPEPLRLPNREAVEKHFRETHRETIIKRVDSHTLTGVAARSLRSAGLVQLVRQGWEEQRRFPLQIATVLSQQFASHGLQFFKVNRAITHVCVARPHYLDLEMTPVSEGVKRIVDFVNAHPKCTRRKLMEALAPSPPPAPIPVAVEPAAPPPATTAETQAPVAAPVPPATQASEPTPEQTAVIADLHWLIHQGHVIEFANGVIETAKKPLPRPPKPEAKPASSAVETTAAAVETSPAPEAVTETTSAPPDLSNEQRPETETEAATTEQAAPPPAEAAAIEQPVETPEPAQPSPEEPGARNPMPDPVVPENPAAAAPERGN